MKIQKFIFCIFCLVPASLYAQKLPKIQSKSLLLPGSFKVDGKAIEWNNVFQAYNNSTNIFYSIANNENNLYLIVQAKDPLIIKKIISGGIAFTVNIDGKRNSNESVVVTYPVLDGIAQSKIAMTLSETGEAKIAAVNKLMTLNAKVIKVIGAGKGTDTLLSVYNQQAIRAKVVLANDNILTYEISLPLRLLEHSGQSLSKITYNIMLNGLKANTQSVSKVKSAEVASVTMIPRGLVNGSNSNYQVLSYPTDVWGEYMFFQK